ncbi:hypothetical protein WA026_019237 [Henosepilachna vigintioctopunctata]|uniref:Uncharacterized protein n=1 Tax=Henosepilachna vigintioctopunctata TaxID=420089 RepID=A0AAW1V0M6_9CUCU
MFGEMNQLQQENLYRTSRRLSLVPITRNSSHGNIVNCSRRHSCFRSEETSTLNHKDDLVLSVLKSPVNHNGLDTPTTITTHCDVTPASEEDDFVLVDKMDDGARYKTTLSEDEHTDENCERLPFLQKKRKLPRFGESHKKVTTPLKKKHLPSHTDHIFVDIIESKDDGDAVDLEEATSDSPKGAQDPYQTVHLPIDQAFKEKYIFSHRKGKTFQARTYWFLEHPGGWLCFIYHFTV